MFSTLLHRTEYYYNHSCEATCTYTILHLTPWLWTILHTNNLQTHNFINVKLSARIKGNKMKQWFTAPVLEASDVRPEANVPKLYTVLHYHEHLIHLLDELKLCPVHCDGYSDRRVDSVVTTVDPREHPSQKNTSSMVFYRSTYIGFSIFCSSN